METTLNFNRPNNNYIFILTMLVISFIFGLIFLFNVDQKQLNNSDIFILEPPIMLTESQIRILEVLSGHAWVQHGKEVNSVFDCFSKYGSTRSFKTNGFISPEGNRIPTNVWMCFDPKLKEWYALVTTSWRKEGVNVVARLVTAYKVSKDVFPSVNSYIQYITTEWMAREIYYVIEAGKILLEPK